jgi:hypothetical protein
MDAPSSQYPAPIRFAGFVSFPRFHGPHPRNARNETNPPERGSDRTQHRVGRRRGPRVVVVGERREVAADIDNRRGEVIFWEGAQWSRRERTGLMSSITLQLPPDTERRLREKADRSGQSLESYLLRLAEQAAAAESGAAKPSPAELTPEQWSAEWRAWAASHRALPGEVDDSRESIYEGRGE